MADPEGRSARVVGPSHLWYLTYEKIVDGDTFHGTIRPDKTNITGVAVTPPRGFRLARCNAPEADETGGPEARDFTARWLNNARGDLWAVPIKLEEYGRIVVEVGRLSTDANLIDALIAAGHAIPVVYKGFDGGDDEHLT